MPTPRSPGLPFIFVTLALDMIGLGLIIPVAPVLVAHLTSDPLTAPHFLGILVALFSTAQLLAAPIFGALSDRFGRRPVLLLSTLLTALSYILAALAPSLMWLLLARTLGGIGAATIGVANAYIADVSAPENRARNFGIAGAAFGLGLIIGPALGGLLSSLDLRLPFLVSATLAALNFLYGLIVLPESRRAEPAPFDPRTLMPLRALGILNHFPGLPVLAAVVLLVSLASQFLTSTWVLHGAVRYGWTPATNGLALALAGVLSATVQVAVLPRVLRQVGPERTVTLGLLTGVAAYVMYGLASAPWMLWASLPIGALSGIAAPALQALTTNKAATHAQGSVQGALAGLTSLSAIAGPLAATALFSHFASPHATPFVPGAAYFAAALLLLGGLAVFAATRTHPALQGEVV
ncbi:MFS transporter [Deinococcus hopiensis]|uniref:MFS transporter, DHA1 family, tetracycline resistance protein n=1 Tax=Deinococcus hopiensis KR-140 TaxID=695939 RepID=A0A1W1UTW6_9DEIO|nr:MFS transporter [Deinococcus hopiensis]SMB84490.1 MFS transporter, DHA1 family, tetracycline resistance protein [Deinococcus hopiensis KR-140]